VQASCPYLQCATRRERGAGKKRGAPTTSWGAMAGQTRLSAGATPAGWPDTWVTDSARAPRDPAALRPAAAQSMSKAAPSRSGPAMNPPPIAGSATRDRAVTARALPLLPVETRTGVHGQDHVGNRCLRLPGKEISRGGGIGARVTPAARCCGPPLAAARLVAPLVDSVHSSISDILFSPTAHLC